MEKCIIADTISPRLTSRHLVDSPTGHVMHDFSFFEDVPLTNNNGTRSRSSIIHSTLVRTMSDPINKIHAVSCSPDPSQEKSVAVTIDVCQPSPTPSVSWETQALQARASALAPPPYSPTTPSSPFRQHPFGTDNKDLLATFEDPLHPRPNKRKLIGGAVVIFIFLILLPLAIFLGVRVHQSHQNGNCVQISGKWIDGGWEGSHLQCS